MAMAPAAYNATLALRTDVTPRLAIFQVTPDERDFTFTAGQYTTLGLMPDAPRVSEAGPEDDNGDGPGDETGGTTGKLIRRAYSISSGSRIREYVEFYISLVSGGALTPRLFALSEGDRLFMGTRAKGMFTMAQVPGERNILMVATGTGLAPYISMLRSQVWGNPNQGIAVLHGASHTWDLGYRGELEELAGRNANFTYLPVVSRPRENPDWSGRGGRLPEWLESAELEPSCGFPLDPEVTHVFLCGNPGMIRAAEAILTARGYRAGKPRDPGSLHVEKYW